MVAPWVILAALQGRIEESILAVGHRQYAASFKTRGQRIAGERDYAIALGKRNERQIQVSPDRERFEGLWTLVANLTKGACRVADYVFDDEETRLLMDRKAETLANLSVAGLIAKTPVHRASDQNAAWAAFRHARAFHHAHADRVKASEGKGGYPAKQFYAEFESLGVFADKLFRAAAPLDLDRRRHAFALAESVFRLTEGQDPLGY